MIENGQEFIFGPYAGANKVQGVHRDNLIPKLEGRMEIFGKKLREFYFKEGIFSESKIYIDALRERQPEDTIEKCVANKEIAGNKPKIHIKNMYSCDRGKRRIQRC
jgi:hypothetical protein